MYTRRFTIGALTVATAALAAVTGVPSDGRADTIHLKKGGRITGVIASETETSLEIRTNLGAISLSKGAIATIERATPEENSALESQWKKERDEEKEKAKASKRFEEEQRAKGLVEYKGTWVPAEKAYEAEKGLAQEKEEWLKTVEQQKKDIQELERRLRDMEARLDQRQRELEYREQQLNLRKQNLLLQQQNLQTQASQLTRERQQTPPKIFAVPRIDVVPAPETGAQP
jgi:DNA repair exonuclease SbcCD ATPase subunit